MRRRRPALLLRALVLALLLALVAAGCGTDEDGASDPSFALALGVDANEPAIIESLSGYRVVVVDGEGTRADAVAALQADGATVLAYLSAGTVEPGRPWFATAESEGWLLEYWDDWDEWYADVSEPGLRDLVVGEARRELDKGFDGLFLDNTDMVEAHSAQRAGMVELVADLDELAGDGRLVFAQNGDPIAAGIAAHLDGWNREDVSSTYDFDAESYVAVSAEGHRAALRDLRRVRDAGVDTFATDYFGEADPEAEAGAARAACDAGAVPFASTIGLTRIPNPPVTCDDL